MAFTKASKKQAKLRMAITGPAGSGKTFTALTLAAGLGDRVAVIDTEHGSASKYADKFSFDVQELSNFHPKNYIQAMKDAVDAGYDVLVIDSLTHAWNGEGGVLQVVEAAASRAKGNTYAGWKEGTPLQNALIDAIVQSRCHVIATMRSKTEYALEKDERTGRTSPRKVGMAPIQRDGAEYEFDVVGDMDVDHTMVITKTRCEELTDAVIKKPGKQLADSLKAWLSDGAIVVQNVGKDEQVPTNQNTVEDRLVLDLTLSNIQVAKTLKDLEDLIPATKELPDMHKEEVRAAYGKRRQQLTIQQLSEATRVLSTP